LTSSTGEEFVATHLLGGQDRVPRLGYGAMQLAGPGVMGLPEDVAGVIEVLRRAVDQGVRFFDTANAYGPRTVNQIIGRALSPFADDIVIGNKVGAWRDPAGGWLTDSRPETVRTQVEDALLDMRAEFSPLTYLRLRGDSQAPGNEPPEEVPLEDSLGAIFVMRVRNGEIVSSRDYHDHLTSARVGGRLGELFAAISAQDGAPARTDAAT
jgi:pyridoxine 4-dehydrogenase